MNRPHDRPAHSLPLAPLVFAVNDDFALPLATALQSLADCAPELMDRIDIRVLHDDLSTAAQDGLRRHADRLGTRLAFHRVEQPELAYNLEFGGTHAHYLRLQIAHTLREESRVLYCDADVLFLASPEPLLRTGTGGLPVAAVRDPTNPRYRGGQAMPGWEQLGVDGDEEYFNSGVMLFDLEVCAREQLFERAYAFIHEHPDSLRFWDQDALNWAARHRWTPLERHWNTFPLSALFQTEWMFYTADDVVPRATLIAEEPRARILHYVSPAKPWKPGFPPGWADDLYRSVLRRTLPVEAAG
ncbi:glycosyltransferase family 8 protein [Streptacidiphilus cavernicola]|uniref:Glycosyltransferase family 8 protein n=1 Tax=Streptacidiphilus cavernicola TaxID=3342716 RepID=A0ABV6VSJ8_9ACTN